MASILPTGTFLGLDRHGFFINPCSDERIREPWRSIVHEARDAYLQHLGSSLRSVYVRGSVARGTAAEYVSDVDMLAVVNGEPTPSNLEWVDSCAEAIENKYPFAVGIEFAVYGYADVVGPLAYPGLRFLLKVLSVCIHGEDLTASIPPCAPSQVPLMHAPQLEENIKEVRLVLASRIDERAVTDLCRWVMKSIVRAGFELVMKDENSYARDLYPCYQAFSRHYPAEEDFMRRALELAVSPSPDPHALLSMLDECRRRLLPEIEARLDSDG
ncbi:MAG TPA: nucleotidyltransferase domain-containing protein [Pyrinomonadaceae bacterium]|jgi:hypothetical protein